jgi:Zn-finger nucleic acid-binding protein
VILACPTCDNRYDVSGYPPGQRFRCRCGTVTALDAPSAQAALLACPQCGAGVSPAANKCEHCAAELLVKACPRCLSRVFHGHKHCPQCGAEVGVAAAGEATRLECPRCASALHARLVGDVLIDECPQCRGLFLDHVAIDRVIRDRRQARAEALVGELPRAEIKPVPPGGKMYLKCPTCRTVMNRKLFAAGSGVIVDVCRAHGTFFDAGELPAVIEFVMNGGLEAAQKKELEREREQVRHDRQAARAEQAAAAHTHGVHEISRGGALVDLLSVLLR